jgi:hypothetical protein
MPASWRYEAGLMFAEWLIIGSLVVVLSHSNHEPMRMGALPVFPKIAL